MLPLRPALRPLPATPATLPATATQALAAPVTIPDEPLPDTLPRLPVDWGDDASSTCMIVGLGDLEPDEILVAADEDTLKDAKGQPAVLDVVATSGSPPPTRGLLDQRPRPTVGRFIQAGLTILVWTVAAAGLGLAWCSAAHQLLHSLVG